MRYWILILFLLSATSIGCSSIKTTAYDRLEDDTIVANPEEHLKGVPVSLRVPTHLELKVVEKTFWRAEGTELIPITSCRRTRTVSHTVKYTEKIFLVDPVRPAAGPNATDQNNRYSGFYGFSFRNDDLTAKQRADGETKEYEDSGKGYLSGLNYHIEDKTIERSAQLLAKSLSFIKTFSPAGVTVGADDEKEEMKLGVLETTRVIAWSRFDLNSEHYEEDVMGFLNTYLNQKNCESESLHN